MKKAVVVATFPYRHQAEFARQILDGAGIRSALLADDAAGMYAGMTFTNPARLLVRREDHDRAARVLRDHGVLEDEDGGGAAGRHDDSAESFDHEEHD